MVHFTWTIHRQQWVARLKRAMTGEVRAELFHLVAQQKTAVMVHFTWTIHRQQWVARLKRAMTDEKGCCSLSDHPRAVSRHCC